MDDIHFRILGPVEVWAGDRKLAVGGPRQLALLSYLLLRRHKAVSGDELREALWGAEYRHGADKRLQMAIHRLRTALRPLQAGDTPVLRTVAGGYLLAPPPGSLDAEVFAQTIDQARAALDAGRAEEAAQRLSTLWPLWRGPPLADVRFEDFAQGEIRRLEELELAARELHVDAELALGHDAGLLAELQALVARHPTRERLAGQLMLAQYRAGRQGEALETYAATRTALVRELGLEPGPALRQLHADILQQAAGLAPAPDRAAAGLPQGTVTMLLTDIEGSTRLLAQVGELYGDVLDRHFEIVRAVCSGHGGVEIATTGDGLFAAFTSPRAALAAGAEVRDALADTDWPQGAKVGARIGVHTGEPRLRAGTYWGEDVHYAARVSQAGHGGQVLVSAATAFLVSDADLTDLGEHRLKDFTIPRRLFQLGGERHPPLRTLDPLRSNLPSSPGPLIGRESECAELLALLRAGESRFVSITGAGGAGKTRLALAIAEAMLPDLPDGAFFVPLADVSTADEVAGAIAAPLGIRLPVNGDEGATIASALADRRILLVLDNVEHLLGVADLIAGLVAGTREVRVLATTQVPLRVRGERVVSLGPLAVPELNSAAGVTDAAAGRLMIERVRELAPGFALTADTAPDVARLCRALGGWPLAIELAAGRLAAIPAGALLLRVQQSIDALGRGSRDLPPRQRGLRAALDWTHELLGEDEARMLRRLSVFAGPAPLERIEQICSDGIDVLEALACLVDFSLVSTAGDGSFYLHGATRAYAREQLAMAGETNDVRRRHAQAFAAAAGSWGRRFLLDVDAVESVVAREEADIGEALSWAADHDVECFARLIGGAALPLVLKSHLTRWRQPIELALQGEVPTAEGQAWMLLAGSLVAWQGTELELARARIAAALTAAQDAGDLWLACLIRTCSILNGVMGEPPDDLRHQYATLRDHVAGLRDEAFIALVEGIEAAVLRCEGRTDEAQPRFAELMEATWRSDFPARMAVYEWPDCLMVAGAHEAALGAYVEALRVAQARVEAQNLALQLEGIAMALSALNRHEEALETHGAADSVRQTAGPIVPPSWRAELSEAMRQSRLALPADVGTRRYARGRTRSVEAAVSAALSLEHQPGPAYATREG